MKKMKKSYWIIVILVVLGIGYYIYKNKTEILNKIQSFEESSTTPSMEASWYRFKERF